MADTGPLLRLQSAPGWLIALLAALVLLLLFARFRILLARRRAHAATPSDARPRDGRFDAFISYKSEDVETARRIADRLVAAGLKVWFAEYQILLAGRDRFQAAIDDGIDRSDWGIALTGGRYAVSRHCRGEMTRLLARRGPGRLVEVRLDADPAVQRLFPELAAAPGIAFAGDLDGTMDFISGATGWPRTAAGVARPRGQLHRGDCLSIPYNIDAAGWELMDPSFQGGGPCYGDRGQGILWNLQYGEELDPSVYDARRRWAGGSVNERALFDEMCRYAERYFSNLFKAEPVGVHLLFVDGIGHFGVSYRVGEAWRRRYSLMLVDPVSYRAAEFVLTFEYRGDVAGYCRRAELMDAVAGSLRWGSADASAPVAPPSLAEARLQRVIDDMPAANRLFDSGMAMVREGRFTPGIAKLEHVLAYSILVEMAGAVHYSIGLAHEQGGDMAAALRHYQAAVTANPRQLNALCNLGALRHRGGDVGAALEYFLAAAAVAPDDPATINNIVLCYRDLGEMGKADDWLARLRATRG